MLESLLVVARQVGILFALMAVGYVCNKRRVLVETGVKGLVEVLVLVDVLVLVVVVFLVVVVVSSCDNTGCVGVVVVIPIRVLMFSS